jgi:hypothetical protein
MMQGQQNIKYDTDDPGTTDESSTFTLYVKKLLFSKIFDKTHS